MLLLHLLFIKSHKDSSLSVKMHHISLFIFIFLTLYCFCNKLVIEPHQNSVGQYPLQLLRYPYTAAHSGVQILEHRVISSVVSIHPAPHGASKMTPPCLSSCQRQPTDGAFDGVSALL